jgi:hypothetical protein
MCEVVGLHGEKLLQAYTKHKAIAELGAKGYYLAEESVLPDGSLKLVLAQPSF